MLRFGVIGCGTIAKVRHIPEIIGHPEAEMAAFYTATPGKAKAFAAEYGGEGYEDLDAFLNSGLDAVVICSPNAFHESQALAAFQHGMHVLCEKPMAMSAEECRRMNEAAEKAGKKLMIAQNQRFYEPHMLAAKAIREGVIGKVLGFDVVFAHGGPEQWCGQTDPWFFYKDRAVLGALGDLGIHKIDLLQHVLGEYFTEVCAVIGTLDKKYSDGTPINVEDNAWMLLKTGSGTAGSLHVGWTQYGKELNSMIFEGTKGVIRCFADPSYDYILEPAGGEVIRINTAAELTNEDVLAGIRKTSGVMDRFIDLIMGRGENAASGEEAAKAMDVIFATVRSQETRRWEAV